MMDRLLEFSRMCELPIQRTDVDLNALYEETFKELVSLHPSKRISLEKQLLPAVKGDAVMLRLVVMNILINAFKFTEGKEKAVITVRAVKNGERVTVLTRDNGAGFDTKNSGKLFSVFQRLHSDEEFEGSGVGLALIKRIITRHGGFVKIEGEIGEGAEIAFTL
jgi:light-regulated signal transduction histidine kinase (bacteriophytochrome)